MSVIAQSAFCSTVVIDELECVQIRHPRFFAEVCLQGSQLTRFDHHSLGEFVWLSASAEYKLGQGLRGGVPICWPWFGVLEKNPAGISQSVLSKKNAHGFARTQIWQLDDIKESAHGVTLELALKQNNETLAIWPFAFELRCRFHFSDALKIELITHNTGNDTFSFSQALHTYLGVDAISQTRIMGAHKHHYVDALDQWKSKTQHGPVIISEEVDRIYLGEIEYSLNDGKHDIALTSNSASSVVWNPWINKSKTLSQFPHDAYKTMLCIENGNILNDIVKLKKNQRHVLNMTLSKQ